MYSATPGGGSGTYYIDNVKVYVEPIAHPTGLKATAGDGMVNLSWTAPEGAETYTVLRSTKEEGPFTPVESTEAQANPVPATVTAFTDKTAVNGTIYYYVVIAENQQGKSAYSNVVSAAPVAAEVEEPLTPPTGLKATAGDGMVNLSWTVSEGAETYTVLRSTDAKGTFEPVKATEAQPNPVMAAVTEFADKTVTNGTTYYYVVIANNQEESSVYSNVVSAAPVATDNGNGGGGGGNDNGNNDDDEDNGSSDNSGNTGNSGGVNPAPSTPAPGQTADSIVLGKEAAQVREEQTHDGAKLQIAAVDAAKLADALKKAAADKAGKVTLDLSSATGNAAAIRADLPVSALTEAGSTELLVKTALAEVKLPSQLILSQLKDQPAGTLQATIAAGSTQLQEKAVQAAKQAGYQLSVQPVSVTLVVESGGQKQELALSSGYASLTLTYSGLLNSTTATGVRIDPVTGEASFAPAIIETAGGRTQVTVLHKGDGIYAVIQGSKTFTDTTGHWAKQDIDLLASKLLIQGTDTYSYSPDQAITRAEFAALLVRSLGLQASGWAASFTDVASGVWYAEAVAAAAGAGLIEGFDNGEFRPGANISREEMAVMAARAARYAGVDTILSTQPAGYIDSSIVSGWAQTSMAWATEKGIIQGTDAQRLAPQDTATRAQSATILKRVLQAMSFIN